MENQHFTISKNDYSSFFGSIIDGCLSLEEDIDGDGNWPDTEKHYSFSEEDTAKLFSIISIDEFIEFCRTHNLSELDRFLELNDIHPRTFVW